MIELVGRRLLQLYHLKYISPITPPPSTFWELKKKLFLRVLLIFEFYKTPQLSKRERGLLAQNWVSLGTISDVCCIVLGFLFNSEHLPKLNSVPFGLTSDFHPLSDRRVFRRTNAGVAKVLFELLEDHKMCFCIFRGGKNICRWELQLLNAGSS